MTLFGKASLAARYGWRTRFAYPLSGTKRYGQLLRIARRTAPRVIIEVGVYTGRRAVEMAEAASLKHAPCDIAYAGFDLFEEIDAEGVRAEFSKRPDAQADVHARIARTGARVELHRGYSQDTLPAAAPAYTARKADLIFIDGGHAVETIAADWQNLQPMIGPRTTVVFDDYYTCPDEPTFTGRFGCNRIVEGLDPAAYAVDILPVRDVFRKDWGRLGIQLVRVRPRG